MSTSRREECSPDTTDIEATEKYTVSFQRVCNPFLEEQGWLRSQEEIMDKKAYFEQHFKVAREKLAFLKPESPADSSDPLENGAEFKNTIAASPLELKTPYSKQSADSPSASKRSQAKKPAACPASGPKTARAKKSAASPASGSETPHAKTKRSAVSPTLVPKTPQAKKSAASPTFGPKVPQAKKSTTSPALGPKGSNANKPAASPALRPKTTNAPNKFGSTRYPSSSSSCSSNQQLVTELLQNLTIEHPSGCFGFKEETGRPTDSSPEAILLFRLEELSRMKSSLNTTVLTMKNLFPSSDSECTDAWEMACRGVKQLQEALSTIAYAEKLLCPPTNRKPGGIPSLDEQTFGELNSLI